MSWKIADGAENLVSHMTTGATRSPIYNSRLASGLFETARLPDGSTKHWNKGGGDRVYTRRASLNASRALWYILQGGKEGNKKERWNERGRERGGGRGREREGGRQRGRERGTSYITTAVAQVS
jgi:hypothetical protein